MLQDLQAVISPTVVGQLGIELTTEENQWNQTLTEMYNVQHVLFYLKRIKGKTIGLIDLYSILFVFKNHYLNLF